MPHASTTTAIALLHVVLLLTISCAAQSAHANALYNATCRTTTFTEDTFATGLQAFTGISGKPSFYVHDNKPVNTYQTEFVFEFSGQYESAYTIAMNDYLKSDRSGGDLLAQTLHTKVNIRLYSFDLASNGNAPPKDNSGFLAKHPEVWIGVGGVALLILFTVIFIIVQRNAARHARLRETMEAMMESQHDGRNTMKRGSAAAAQQQRRPPPPCAHAADKNQESSPAQQQQQRGQKVEEQQPLAPPEEQEKGQQKKEETPTAAEEGNPEQATNLYAEE